MDIITRSVHIKGTSDPAGAIIQALCDFGTPENPREPSADEKWQAIKTVRDELLAACDWTQVADAALTDNQKAAWQEYRQALRDIPQVYETPESVIFPEVPNG